MVPVPSREDEDDRHLHRSLKTLKQKRTAIGNRMRGLLKTQGISWAGPILKQSAEALGELRDWEGVELGAGIQARIRIQIELFHQVGQPIGALEKQRREQVRQGEGKKLDQIRLLESLKGVGIKGAWTLVMEAFGWREFRNRRQVGACLGMTPCPYQSGSSHREQGISKAGNRWCRDVLGELAWTWVQYQPNSELTLWFEQRFAQAGPRARKVGIVALGRKLVIQL